MKLPSRIYHRWKLILPDVLLSAFAASLSWIVAQQVMGSERPVLAATAAIICLAPGLASRAHQSLGMIVGMSTGIIIGSLEFTNFDLTPPLYIALGSTAAMLAAATFGMNPINFIQAGAAAILVGVGGEADLSMLERLGESAIGVCMALIISQILFSPSPIYKIEKNVRKMYQALAVAFASGDRDLYHQALRQSIEVENSLVVADRISQHTLKGRLQREEVHQLKKKYSHTVTNLCAAALTFHEEHISTQEIEVARNHIAKICEELAKNHKIKVSRNFLCKESSLSPSLNQFTHNLNLIIST